MAQRANPERAFKIAHVKYGALDPGRRRDTPQTWREIATLFAVDNDRRKFARRDIIAGPWVRSSISTKPFCNLIGGFVETIEQAH